MSSGPRTPLIPKYLALRQEILAGNGVNYNFPLGRSYEYSYPGYMEVYDGSGLSFFGYINNPSPVCELGLEGYYNGIVLIKTNSSSKLTLITRPDGGSITYTGAGNNYYQGQPFAFRFRAAYVKRLDKNSVTAYEGDYLQYEQPMYYKQVKVHEYFASPGSHVILSVHYGDFPPSLFPEDKGLDPIIAGFVVMDIGSYAVYRGTYKGTDPIKIMATGSVRDLGKPPNANDAVTIGIRKNLTMYVFIADYGTDPVAAPFSELVDEGGHNYVPRFSPNFIIKQVQIEAYY